MYENKVLLEGKIATQLEYDTTLYRDGKPVENLYKFKLETKRLSENIDSVPVVISENLININRDHCNKFIRIRGQFRSYNKRDENDKNHLFIYVFVNSYEFINEDEIDLRNSNKVCFVGNITKPVILRETLTGVRISDLLIAVDKNNGKRGYFFPCICWHNNAIESALLKVGNRIEVHGRIQSREYDKTRIIKVKLQSGEIIDKEITETFTAYEVSVNKFEKC